MNQNSMMKQMVNFQKNSFNVIFNNMAVARTRSVRNTDRLLNYAFWIPEHLKDSTAKYENEFQKICDSYKKISDEYFEKIEAATTTP